MMKVSDIDVHCDPPHPPKRSSNGTKTYSKAGNEPMKIRLDIDVKTELQECC